MNWRSSERHQDFVIQVKKLSRPTQKILSLLVEFYTAAFSTNKYRLPEHGFEALHLQRDCRLGSPDAFRSPCKALFFGNYDETAQNIEIKSDRESHDY